MKANTPDLLKFKKLQKRLSETTRGIVGLLELLWLATAKNCPRGDIGKFANDEIALLIDWDGDPEQLIAALIDCGWVDVCEENRLVVHDWSEHCPNYVKGSLAKHNRIFASAKQPARQCAKQPARQCAKEPAKETAKQVARHSATKPSQAKPSQVSPVDSGFESWFSSYPRRVNKKTAKKAYEKAIKEISIENDMNTEIAISHMQTLTDERMPDLKARQVEFIPHPASWLNAGGYMNDVVAVGCKPIDFSDPTWRDRRPA